MFLHFAFLPLMPFENVEHRLCREVERIKERKNYFVEDNTGMPFKRCLIIYISFYEKLMYMYNYKNYLFFLASANAFIL